MPAWALGRWAPRTGFWLETVLSGFGGGAGERLPPWPNYNCRFFPPA